MTLASLKKRAPSVERKVVSVDEFIDDAEYYARGQSKVVCLREPQNVVAHEEQDEVLRRATFTLGDSAIAQLNALSEKTGIPKSRLIRIWLDRESQEPNLLNYLISNTR